MFVYQSQVRFGDTAVLEAAVRPASCSLVEGDTESTAGGEIQLMTEPEETEDEKATDYDDDVSEQTETCSSDLKP